MKENNEQDLDTLLDQYLNSGMSLNSFAQQVGVDYHKLNYRHRKRREAKNKGIKKFLAPSFVQLDAINPISLAAEDRVSTTKVILTFPGGLRLEIFG
jgi:hypothetical protein